MEYERVYARIDLDAIAHNISLVKQKIPDHTKLMLIIKADAYGHGAVPIAKNFEAEADYFGVAEMNEALELRRAGIRKPILILGYTSPHLFETALANDITLTMFQYEAMKTLSQTAVRLGKTARVHFGVDTGMSRIGFRVTEEDAEKAVLAAKFPNIDLEGVFSHFALADTFNKMPSMLQRDLFDRFVSMMEEKGVRVPICHLNNSAGILSFDRYYDMVREGIILYGLYPSEDIREELNGGIGFRPAMSLITHISHIKTLEAHNGISYGHTFITDKSMRIATIPVGYADGYPRALSNKGVVLIHGKRCSILGRVCMDQMMVDITDIPQAKIEDRVTLVGCDGDEWISAEEVADASYSFNYEFVCGIARRVPRIYVKNGEIIEKICYLDHCTL